MTNQDRPTIYLSDYQPPAFLIDHVELEFKLHPTKTRVLSKIKFPVAKKQISFFLVKNLN